MGGCGPLVRGLSGEGVVEGCAQAVQVASDVEILMAPGLFRTDVVRGSEPFARAGDVRIFKAQDGGKWPTTAAAVFRPCWRPAKSTMQFFALSWHGFMGRRPTRFQRISACDKLKKGQSWTQWPGAVCRPKGHTINLQKSAGPGLGPRHRRPPSGRSADTGLKNGPPVAV